MPNPTLPVHGLQPPAVTARNRTSTRQQQARERLEQQAGPRYRWAVWHRQGVLPPDLPPATLARGYRLAYGRDPARDPERQACRAYSAAELAAALEALDHPAAPPPPGWAADLLELIWDATLRRLPLPSLRLLLSHQARLVELRPSPYPLRRSGELLAVVAVQPSWLTIASGRGHVIANALGETLQRVVAVELTEVEL